ncbi:phage/plasmid primase, P4 family, C-terminal domain protein [Methanomethylovorans hollandica DSM 15978]|uniref:Phage/plasmid primase, P4 family, C-terminal domain protein n=1 Tax=Methanomethylovorans hollandica (strain DSM 15978 / NBRC 107637 / DMS1) TaxID=867904 RepID=L0KY85_METHD|nr:DNA primase family protein [Methanomethylovorans hollandica]AGB48939.1 phage/plasmid primase, P4 family, C-terminal domain protein [Methanomethylovorans hollandica DSM 15978]
MAKIDVAEYMLTHTKEELEGLPGVDVWTKLLSMEPVPESPQDKVRAFKNFIFEHLVDMDPVERAVFCRENGKNHFGLTKGDINTILKGVTFKSGDGRYFTGDGSFIPSKLSEDLQQKHKFITTPQGKWVYHPDTGCYQMDGEELIRRETRDALGIHSNEHYGNEVVYDISISTRKDADVFNGNSQYVNLQNGYINISSGEFFEHSPNVYFTYALPFKYDARAECPQFEKFLNVAGIDRIDALELIAYCLVPGYPIHSIHVLIGDGGNGKGTFIRLLTRLLGPENTTSYTMQELAKDPYAKAGLYGKLANLCGDMPGNRVEDTATIKSLSGGDKITARNIYGKPFDFINGAKQIYSMNQMPEYDDNTDSTYRRHNIILFKNLVEGATEGFNEEALAEEIPGIFNQALHVLPDLLKRKKFSVWRSIEETRSLVQMKSNSVAAFLATCVTVGDGETTVQDAYTAYTKFCVENGETRVTNTVFGRRLKKQHPDDIQRVPKITAGVRTFYYVGISLNPGYKNLSAFVVDTEYFKKHCNNLDKCDTAETPIDTANTAIDTAKTQINNLIFQQHETELPIKDTDNSTIFNNRSENKTDVPNVCSGVVERNAEFAVSDGENTAADNESAENHLCLCCVWDPADSVLSVSDVSGWIDDWEKSNGPIYGKKAIQAAQDICKNHRVHSTEYSYVEAAVKKRAAVTTEKNDAKETDPKLIFEAVEKRSKGRCLDCGVDTHLNEEIGKGYRCKQCHDVYSNPPPVVIPEEISLEPADSENTTVSYCKEPGIPLQDSVRKYCRDWEPVKKASINSQNYMDVVTDYLKGYILSEDMRGPIAAAVMIYAKIPQPLEVTP